MLTLYTKSLDIKYQRNSPIFDLYYLAAKSFLSDHLFTEKPLIDLESFNYEDLAALSSPYLRKNKLTTAALAKLANDSIIVTLKRYKQLGSTKIRYRLMESAITFNSNRLKIEEEKLLFPAWTELKPIHLNETELVNANEYSNLKEYVSVLPFNNGKGPRVLVYLFKTYKSYLDDSFLI